MRVCFNMPKFKKINTGFDKMHSFKEIEDENNSKTRSINICKNTYKLFINEMELISPLIK